MKANVKTRRKYSAVKFTPTWEAIVEAYDSYPDICAIEEGDSPEEAKAKAISRYIKMVDAKNNETNEEVEIDI